MKKLLLVLALFAGLQAYAFDFSARDTVTNKEPGAAPTAAEFDSADLNTKTTLYTTNDFKGTLNTVYVAATARSSNGYTATNVPQINANVFVTVGTTETEMEIPLLLWDNGETDTLKYDTLAIPLNIRFINAENATVAVTFSDDDNGNGFTMFSGMANLGYTLDN